MAQITLGPGGAIENNSGWWVNLFSDRTLVGEIETRATFQDGSGNEIIIDGSGLSSGLQGNVLGVVEKIVIKNGAGLTILTATDLGVDYAAIYQLLLNGWIGDLIQTISTGDDEILGTSLSDEIIGASNLGNDTIFGFAGDDHFHAGPGDNSMDAGDGIDILDYSTGWWSDALPKQGVVVDVNSGTATNTWSGTDAFQGFEIFKGSQFSDQFLGSGGSETFVGLDGSDVFNGALGIDTVSFADDAALGGLFGVKVDLTKGTAIDGFRSVDTVLGIENVIGTANGDTITGSKVANTIDGHGGTDSVTGKKGSDTFVFKTGYGELTITDFVGKGKNHDVLDLTQITSVSDFDDLVQNHTEIVGNELHIDLGDGDAVILEDMSMSAFKSISVLFE